MVLITTPVFAWYDADYSYRQKLTLDTSVLTGSVTEDLPILIDVNSENSDFWSHVKTDGEDVRFVAADDTTALDYYFETFNHTTDSMLAWVEVTDTFNATTDIEIYMYYGYASAADGQNQANTYNSDFNAVYNMADVNGGIDDGTGVYDGTEAGDPTYQQTGQIGYGIDFDGTGDYYNLGFHQDGETAATFMFWVNFDDGASAGRGLIGSQGAGNDGHFIYGHSDGSGTIYYKPSDGTTILNLLTTDYPNGAPSGWVQVTGTFDGTNGNLYINGVLKDTDVLGAPAPLSCPTYNYFLGAWNGSGSATYDFAGLLDEVKVLSSALSADAVKLLYLSETDTLITFGAETVPDVPIIANFDYFVNNATETITLTDTSTTGAPLEIDSWTWYKDTVQFSTDQNTTTPAVQNTDYNICLLAEDISESEENMNCQTVSVGDWSPTVELDFEAGPWISGNYAIDFNVQNPTNRTLGIKLYYSASELGFDDLIVNDTNVSDGATITCNDYNFLDETSCSYTWNTTTATDGNYYLDVNAWTYWNDANDSKTIAIDNVAPVTTWDGNNNVWKATDQTITLTCADGAGSGCASTAYRIDTDYTAAVSMGAWVAYSSPFAVHWDGNIAIDFNSTDTAGNTETTTRYFTLIDKAVPVTAWSGDNNVWKNSAQTITLTCSDANASAQTSGCNETYYRVDADDSNVISYGSWQTYTGAIAFNYDGNRALDFNSQDVIGNTETTLTRFVLIDTNNPTITMDFNYTTGFSTDLNINFILTCTDGLSPQIHYLFVLNDSNILNEYDTNNTERTIPWEIQNGVNNFNARCMDLAGNTATDSNSATIYAVNMSFIDEDTGDPFAVADLNDLIAFSYDGNVNYDIAGAGPYWYISNDNVLRFDITYNDGGLTKIEREIDFSLIDDSNVSVCIAGWQTIYTNLFISNSEQPIILFNDFAECYNYAGYTKFAYETALMARTYTINKPYYLYTWIGGVKSILALIEGSTAEKMYLDVLIFNETVYDVTITTDTVAFEPLFNTVTGEYDTNTVQIYYKSQTGTNESVRMTLFNGSTQLWTYTETSDVDEFVLNLYYGGFDVFDENILKLVVLTTSTTGETNTTNYYFNIAGASYSGLLDPFIAIALAFLLIAVGITLVAYDFAMGWFGLIIELAALAVLSAAPGYWYVLVAQAVVLIIVVFTALSFKNEIKSVVN